MDHFQVQTQNPESDANLIDCSSSQGYVAAKFYKNVGASFWVLLLTDKQTQMDLLGGGSSLMCITYIFLKWYAIIIFHT